MRLNEPVTEQPPHGREEADTRAADPWTPRAAALVVVGLTLLAAGLRFFRVDNWSLDSDEVFMQRDSITLRLSNPRPLMYFLNHYLVRPFVPLDELGLRILPALCGALAVPAIYWASRRLVGTRAALLAALLVAVSSQLVYYSQFGRYWTLVFLLACVYPYALYLGFRDSHRGLQILGAVLGVLAVFAHPVSVLSLGGLGVWVIAVHGSRERLADLWRQKRVRIGVVISAILAVLITLRFVPMLQAWIAANDKIPKSEGGGEFLLHAPGGQGVKQISLLLAYVENLTIPLVLCALLGIYLLWRGRTRSTALLLTCLCGFPIAFIVLVSVRTSVSTFYLVPAIPPLFIAAGVFLDRLAGIDLGLRPRWLVSAVVLAMILHAGAPTLVSQYRDGRRWDFRSAARWLDDRLAPEDVVFSDQPLVTAYYLPKTDVRRLIAQPARLIEAQKALRETGRGGVLWLVAPAPSHAFRTNANINSLSNWMYANCQLRTTIGVGRVDFRQNFLQVFRCPPVGAEATAAISSALPVSRRGLSGSEPRRTVPASDRPPERDHS